MIKTCMTCYKGYSLLQNLRSSMSCKHTSIKTRELYKLSVDTLLEYVPGYLKDGVTLNKQYKKSP